MGCRPSKHATSKIRDSHSRHSQCTCVYSPRKYTKKHKCNSTGNISRMTSSATRSGSFAQSSGDHRSRSHRSDDNEFPAFSTTTAVYRRSSSKASKITLRLSCDGSTLEIEQCDYDIAKMRPVKTRSRPRPWSSAPNLTKSSDRGHSHDKKPEACNMKPSASALTNVCSSISPHPEHCSRKFVDPVSLRHRRAVKSQHSFNNGGSDNSVMARVRETALVYGDAIDVTNCAESSTPRLSEHVEGAHGSDYTRPEYSYIDNYPHHGTILTSFSPQQVETDFTNIYAQPCIDQGVLDNSNNRNVTHRHDERLVVNHSIDACRRSGYHYNESDVPFVRSNLDMSCQKPSIVPPGYDGFYENYSSCPSTRPQVLTAERRLINTNHGQFRHSMAPYEPWYAPNMEHEPTLESFLPRNFVSNRRKQVRSFTLDSEINKIAAEKALQNVAIRMGNNFQEIRLPSTQSNPNILPSPIIPSDDSQTVLTSVRLGCPSLQSENRFNLEPKLQIGLYSPTHSQCCPKRDFIRLESGVDIPPASSSYAVGDPEGKANLSNAFCPRPNIGEDVDSRVVGSKELCANRSDYGGTEKSEEDTKRQIVNTKATQDNLWEKNKVLEKSQPLNLESIKPLLVCNGMFDHSDFIHDRNSNDSSRTKNADGIIYNDVFRDVSANAHVPSALPGFNKNDGDEEEEEEEDEEDYDDCIACNSYSTDSDVSVYSDEYDTNADDDDDDNDEDEYKNTNDDICSKDELVGQSNEECTRNNKSVYSGQGASPSHHTTVHAVDACTNLNSHSPSQNVQPVIVKPSLTVVHCNGQGDRECRVENGDWVGEGGEGRDGSVIGESKQLPATDQSRDADRNGNEGTPGFDGKSPSPRYRNDKGDEKRERLEKVTRHGGHHGDGADANGEVLLLAAPCQELLGLPRQNCLPLLCYNYAYRDQSDFSAEEEKSESDQEKCPETELRLFSQLDQGVAAKTMREDKAHSLYDEVIDKAHSPYDEVIDKAHSPYDKVIDKADFVLPINEDDLTRVPGAGMGFSAIFHHLMRHGVDTAQHRTGRYSSISQQITNLITVNNLRTTSPENINDTVPSPFLQQSCEKNADEYRVGYDGDEYGSFIKSDKQDTVEREQPLGEEAYNHYQLITSSDIRSKSDSRPNVYGHELDLSSFPWINLSNKKSDQNQNALISIKEMIIECNIARVSPFYLYVQQFSRSRNIPSVQSDFWPNYYSDTPTNHLDWNFDLSKEDFSTSSTVARRSSETSAPLAGHSRHSRPPIKYPDSGCPPLYFSDIQPGDSLISDHNNPLSLRAFRHNPLQSSFPPSSIPPPSHIFSSLSRPTLSIFQNGRGEIGSLSSIGEPSSSSHAIPMKNPVGYKNDKAIDLSGTDLNLDEIQNNCYAFECNRGGQCNNERGESETGQGVCEEKEQHCVTSRSLNSPSVNNEILPGLDRKEKPDHVEEKCRGEIKKTQNEISLCSNTDNGYESRNGVKPSGSRCDETSVKYINPNRTEVKSPSDIDTLDFENNYCTLEDEGEISLPQNSHVCLEDGLVEYNVGNIPVRSNDPSTCGVCEERNVFCLEKLTGYKEGVRTCTAHNALYLDTVNGNAINLVDDNNGWLNASLHSNLKLNDHFENISFACHNINGQLMNCDNNISTNYVRQNDDENDDRCEGDYHDDNKACRFTGNGNNEWIDEIKTTKQTEYGDIEFPTAEMNRAFITPNCTLNTVKSEMQSNADGLVSNGFLETISNTQKPARNSVLSLVQHFESVFQGEIREAAPST